MQTEASYLRKMKHKTFKFFESIIKNHFRTAESAIIYALFKIYVCLCY